MADQSSAARIAACVGDLPAIPSVVSEVLRLTDDPKSDIARISETIHADPALTAKVLRVSNSPYYGMKQYIGTLKLAMVILGVRAVRNVVLGISVFETFRDDRGDAQFVLNIWNNSLKTASLTKSLARCMGLGLMEEEFTAGLLSNIGKMMLLNTVGNRYTAILRNNAKSVEGLCAAEKLEIGCTHADLAMALAVHWNLPQTLADALWCQYPNSGVPLLSSVEPKLCAVLRIARAALVDDFDGDAPLKCLSDTEAWDVLADAKKPLSPET
jgi:HD-like signal output (HDOD) protein